MISIDYEWVDIECPLCGYQDKVQLIDIRTEKSIFCHNCKITIQLRDDKASAHTSIREVNNALNELDRMFKSFGK